MVAMLSAFLSRLRENHRPRLLELFRYLGPGILVTVGFIDPGNWASNVAAGAQYGYSLLWMVTLSTFMLILLQHNAAHLGIVSGLCLSEAAKRYLPSRLAQVVLASAFGAGVATAFAEVLGAAIALEMLFGLPVRAGACLAALLIGVFLFTHTYNKMEKVIIGFVSIIGFCFLYELSLISVDWPAAARGWTTPSLPEGALPVVMSVLGAVVMPHNLFLHSEVIQSRQWNLENDTVIRRQLRYEFLDTLFSMSLGWAINSAMILVAAATFFADHIAVTELSDAQAMLAPLLGNSAATLFAVALLFAGVASSVTAGMAGGSIFAGAFGEPYNIRDLHTRIGVVCTLLGAVIAVFFISDPFQGLVYSQMLLSVQLPITIFLQLFLTGSKRVMGKYANTRLMQFLLWLVGAIVAILNMMLLQEILFP